VVVFIIETPRDHNVDATLTPAEELHATPEPVKVGILSYFSNKLI
jgi:hypothetical protein